MTSAGSFNITRDPDHGLLTGTALGTVNVFLEVRPSNGRALQLYERAGFKEIGLRPDYYPAHEAREDALTLALQLTTRRSPG